jgi:hypothetical protein
VRSAVPYKEPGAWWGSHTHITALTPVETGRAIVNGTFTHPSPVAALVYRGDAGRAPIQGLVEGRDGLALFGKPLRKLDATELEANLRRMRVSTIVALEDDAADLKALAADSRFTRRAIPPFVIWEGPPQPLPQAAGPGLWRVPVHGIAGEWTAAGFAYYPLWHATANGREIETRRGADGQLEVRAPEGGFVDLAYAAGWAERSGIALSMLGVALWLALFSRFGAAIALEPRAAVANA